MTRQRLATRKPSRPTSYRPRLDHLESRVVPAPVTFRFRPFASSVTLDPTLTSGTTNIQVDEQGPGSLTTGYAGRQQGDLDLGAETIQFLDPGSSTVNAQTNGTWRPGVGGTAGSAPADYGGEFSFLGDNYLALRDVVVSLTSGPITLTNQGGGAYTFPVNTITFNLKGANLDYETSPLLAGSGTTTFTGTAINESAANGTLTPQGASYVVSVPIEGSIFVDLGDGITSTTDFNGTLGGLLPPAPPSPIPGVGRGFTSVAATEFFSGAPTPIDSNSTSALATETPLTQTPSGNGATARVLPRVASHNMDSVFSDPLAMNGF